MVGSYGAAARQVAQKLGLVIGIQNGHLWGGMGGIAQKVVGHCRDVWPRAEFDNRVPIVEILIVFQRQKKYTRYKSRARRG